jgi:hypothetical protein
MQISLVITAGLLLSGCASVFDPAPYDPTRDPTSLSSGPEKITNADVLLFDNLRDGLSKLKVLSDSYAQQRDTIMRQQLGFDFALLGLTMAAVVNPIYQGARATTVGLGLGAATVGAGRVYFSPQTRIMAYNGAAIALSCAASVAAEMALIEEGDRDRLVSVAHDLEGDLANANALLLSGGASGQGGTALLAARDRAQMAFTRLAAASALLKNARGRLQTFAAQTIRAATSRVVTGTQNLDAALGVLKAAVPVPPSSPAPVAANRREMLRSGSADTSALTQRLDTNATEAEQLAATINEAWNPLLACTGA